MEDRYQHTVEGQAIIEEDLNLLGEVGALADDRILAELLRLAPYDGSDVVKAVLTHESSASGTAAIVAPNGATGAVVVRPFRAIVGSRTAAASDAKANWRDIRSAIGVGATTLDQVVTFAANSSGNPRWDLVYAAVAVDANASAVDRFVLDATSGGVTATSLVVRKRTTVTIGVQSGIAAASPVWSAVPSDAAGVYYVPLAHVRIPNGFGASSTVLSTDIAVVAPAARLSSAMGAVTTSPGTTTHALPTATQQAWGASGTRPKHVFPSDFVGGQVVWLALDMANSSTANHSHVTGDVIDARDWRGRIVRWEALAISDASGDALPWTSGLSDTEQDIGLDGTSSGARGFGQTLIKNVDSNNSCVVRLTPTDLPSLTDEIAIYCDHSASGALKLHLESGDNPRALVLIRLEFSSPFSNR